MSPCQLGVVQLVATVEVSWSLTRLQLYVPQLLERFSFLEALRPQDATRISKNPLSASALSFSGSSFEVWVKRHHLKIVKTISLGFFSSRKIRCIDRSQF